MRFTGPILATLVASGAAFEHMAPTEELVERAAEAQPELELEERSGGRPSCPAVWTQVSSKLSTDFVTGGQCNDLARAAIRAAFHDAGSWNTAQTYASVDASLCLNAEENSRGENKGLQQICTYYTGLKQNNFPSITVADLIQFAGAAAVVLCPGGQPYTLLVGRTDSTVANTGGLLPPHDGSGASLYQLFQDKGFSAVDLAALLGAHTCSKQFSVNATVAGASQDTTPGLWDVKYYAETLDSTVIAENTANKYNDFAFAADKNLAAHPVVGKEFQGFVNNQGKWTGKFGSAMNKMSLLGVKDSSNWADCTNSLPQANSKRDIKRALLGAKAV